MEPVYTCCICQYDLPKDDMACFDPPVCELCLGEILRTHKDLREKVEEIIKPFVIARMLKDEEDSPS